LCYSELTRYDIISYYKLHAISKAVGILANRKQSIKRGYRTKTPYLTKGILVSCYGFKIENGILKVPLGNKHYFDIPLNKHTKNILSDAAVTVRSFTLTANNTVSICYSKEVAGIECATIAGVDRNLYNLSFGNNEKVMQYDLSKAVDIAENTRSIVKSFKRNDVRIRRKISGKYGKRRKNRMMDRDVVAAMNVGRRGAEVFQRSKGLAGEAMKGNAACVEPLILRVDASKLSRCQPKVDRVVNQPKT